MRWRRCAPRVPQSADPRPRPAQCAPLSPNLEPAVQVAAMVEQHGLSAQQQADRKQQVLSELRARIGDMDDDAAIDAELESLEAANTWPTSSEVLQEDELEAAIAELEEQSGIHPPLALINC